MRRTASVNRRGLVIEDAPPGANLPTSLFIRARYGYGGTPSSEQGPNESYTPILKQSDVILVHQTHANGWADGTVVRESTRGWIPTNYCEAYDPENIRSLLVAVADLWTFISTRDGRDQPLEGGLNRLQPMIAGVRSLLVRSNLQMLKFMSHSLSNLQSSRMKPIVYEAGIFLSKTMLLSGPFGRTYFLTSPHSSTSKDRSTVKSKTMKKTTPRRCNRFSIRHFRS